MSGLDDIWKTLGNVNVARTMRALTTWQAQEEVVAKSGGRHARLQTLHLGEKC